MCVFQVYRSKQSWYLPVRCVCLRCIGLSSLGIYLYDVYRSKQSLYLPVRCVCLRCIGLSSLGIYLYTELCRGVVSAKLYEAVNVILSCLQVSFIALN